jgi:hypothetical protein
LSISSASKSSHLANFLSAYFSSARGSIFTFEETLIPITIASKSLYLCRNLFKKYNKEQLGADVTALMQINLAIDKIDRLLRSAVDKEEADKLNDEKEKLQKQMDSFVPKVKVQLKQHKKHHNRQEEAWQKSF